MQFVALTQELRQRLNQTGHSHKRLVQVGDGSFCNRTVLREDWEAQNVTVVARCRKDIVLVPTRSGPRPPFLWQDQVHPRAGPPARFAGPVAEGPDLPWRLLSGGALQGTEQDLLARRLPQTRGAPVGGGAGGLPHQQERAQVLSPARLSADHRPEHAGRRYYCKPTSIAGASKSIIGTRRTSWAWARPKSGMSNR